MALLALIYTLSCVINHSFWETSLHGLTYSFEPGRAAFYHTVETSDYWVWIALETGRFWYRVGNGKNSVEGECGPHDWVLCPPGEPLYRRMLEPCAFHYARFECNSDGFRALRGGGTLRNAERLRSDFSALKEGQIDNAPCEWTTHLLLDIFRHAYCERQQEFGPTNTDPVMQNAREWLEMHRSEKISLELLAGELRLSPSTFSRRFKTAIGMGPMEFLQEKRFDMARQLLLETDLTLDAIATRCGFATGFYFSRLWTKRYGIAPARFRRAHRI